MNLFFAEDFNILSSNFILMLLIVIPIEVFSMIYLCLYFLFIFYHSQTKTWPIVVHHVETVNLIESVFRSSGIKRIFVNI